MDETKKALDKVDAVLQKIEQLCPRFFISTPREMKELLMEARAALAVLRAAFHANEFGGR